MSLKLSISDRARDDLALQYSWYLKNAGEEIAERYLEAFNTAALRLASYPS